MRTFFESIAVTLAMYTKLPVPNIIWNDKNMRYSFLIFPFVGLIIAGIIYALIYCFYIFGLSPVFFSAIAVAVSVIITGGLHLDGFCDTSDALSSNRDREEKLRILKDPNVGAFAVIYTVIVLLLQFGAWVQIFSLPQYWLQALIGFIISRILISIAVVSFPCARNSGLASVFAGYASKVLVRNILLTYMIISFLGLVYLQPISGMFIIAYVLVSFLWFYSMVKKQFGGITGDLAGFYLVVCETGILSTLAVVGGMIK